jgi:hypothetical protein
MRRKKTETLLIVSALHVTSIPRLPEAGLTVRLKLASDMKQVPGAKPVERLFPFVLRSRILLLGRDTLVRSKSKLHFVLITMDISENSRTEVLSEFAHYPVVQHYQMEDLENHFGLKSAKVIGFAKSGLAQSLYAELKQYRINKPSKTGPEHR